MPVYRMEISGLKSPILVRAESAAKAKDQIVDVKALTSEEMADALMDGAAIHVAGNRVVLPDNVKPVDEPVPPVADDNSPQTPTSKKG